jgi:hypothetical protein
MLKQFLHYSRGLNEARLLSIEFGEQRLTLLKNGLASLGQVSRFPVAELALDLKTSETCHFLHKSGDTEIGLKFPVFWSNSLLVSP